jgi:hypothetical protein
MVLILFTFASAFLIEGLGTWISIIGLSSLFSADPIIIALAAALDVGKVVTVSFLYKRWTTVPWLLRAYLILATAVLMIITSAGAFGYLSAAFQGAIQDTKQQRIMVAAIVEEKAKLEARKKEIDAQIANLPANIVQGRQKLMAAFKGEADRINRRLRQLDVELPRLRVEEIAIHTHAGPIVYVSQAFDVSLEQAVKYVILVIIFVFDPLAIALLVAGNFLWEARARERQALAAVAGRADKLTEPLPATPLGLAEAVPSPVTVARAEPIGVAIPVHEAPAEGAAIDAEPGRSAVHRETSERAGEQTVADPPEPTGRADVDGRAANADRAVAITVGEEVPDSRNREQAIRERAYYIAEQRRFQGGEPVDDWATAEKEVANHRPTVD